MVQIMSTANQKLSLQGAEAKTLKVRFDHLPFTFTKILFFVIGITSMYNVGQYNMCKNIGPSYPYYDYYGQPLLPTALGLGSFVVFCSCLGFLTVFIPKKWTNQIRFKILLIVLSLVTFICTVVLLGISQAQNGINCRGVTDLAASIMSMLCSGICVALSILDCWILKRNKNWNTEKISELIFGSSNGEDPNSTKNRLDQLEKRIQEISYQLTEKQNITNYPYGFVQQTPEVHNFI